jgi:hypothetical protein
MSTYDPSRPAPTLVSAENVGAVPGDATGLINVRIVYEDADPTARLISAYFQSPTDPPATQNIEPVVASGEATVPIGGTVTSVMLRHMWGTLPGDGSDIVWGPWSGEMTIETASAPDGGTGNSGKGKGHGKGGSKA